MQGFFDSVWDFIKNTAKQLEPGMLIGVAVLVFLLLFFIYYRKANKPLAGTTEWIDREITKPRFRFFTQRHRMEKKDIVPFAIIAVVFSFLSLFQLGNTSAPQSFHRFSQGERSIKVELVRPEEITKIMYYPGLPTSWDEHYTLELSANGLRWSAQELPENPDPEATPSFAMSHKRADVFKWLTATLNDGEQIAKYIRITASRTPIELGELALFGSDGELIPLVRIADMGAPELFDEQELIPERSEYMNSMYFDEIYHGRTAYEYTRGFTGSDTAHPPLGKIIMSASVAIFGMTPFGWRFAGAFAGIVMLLVMYIFLKNIFGKTTVAVCGSLLFGFDFMRFTQSRLATIDTYSALFILLTFFFMYWYITTDPDARFRKSLLPLALSGISFGLGCACKWVAPYAGLALVTVYILRIVFLNKHYRKNELGGFGVYLAKTLLFSVLFFVIVPAVIYYLSYIPNGLAKDMTIGGGMLWNPEYFKLFWDNQVLMFNFHSTVVSTHPYSSRWYQWIINARPILYYNNYSASGSIRSSFGAFGNPIVWWGGLLAMGNMAFRTIRHRDWKALFILVGYLSQILPWVVIARIVFVYHYFPGTLFLVMAIAHMFNTIIERSRGKYKLAVYGYTAFSGVLFGLFYPALSGVYAPQWYFKNLLRWIPGAWPF